MISPSRRTLFSLLPAAVALRAAEANPFDDQFEPTAPPPQQMPVREGHVKVPGAELFYWDTGGTGVPILLAHAGTGSAYAWQYQQPVFATAGYRVIAFSRRGYSGTKVLDERAVYSALEDIDGLVDELKLRRFHALGTAAGGGIMLDYAVKRPTKLLSLIVASAIGNIGDESYRKASAALRPPEFHNLPIEFQELGPCYRATSPDGVARWVDLVKKAGKSLRETSIRTPTQWNDIASLAMPILWMTGDADPFIPPPLLAHFHRHSSQSDFCVVDGSGHSIYWERPDVFNAAVLDFLKRRG